MSVATETQVDADSPRRCAEAVQLPPLDQVQGLVLYDGVCGLCDKLVQWLLDRDGEGRFRFAPLQGETAARIRRDHPEIPERLDSIIFVDGGQLYWESRAVFRIASQLKGWPRWLRVFSVFPRLVTDLGYRIVAAVRYRIFGKHDVCRIPTAEERGRFLP